MNKACDLLPFQEQPDHIMVVQHTGEDFTRLYFYNGRPFDFGIFITRKNTESKRFELEYYLNVEDGRRNREERDFQVFDNSKQLVEYINFKLGMMRNLGF